MEQNIINMVYSWDSDRRPLNWHLLDVLRGISFIELENNIRRRLPDCCCPGQFRKCQQNLASIRRVLEVNDICRHEVSARANSENRRQDAEEFLRESRELTISRLENA